MEFGYFTLSDNHYDNNRRSANAFIADILDEALYAEEVGLHSAWIGEHHFSSLGVLSCPDLVLAQVAALTRRIRLAPAVTVLPLHHPIRVAEQWASLDLLSNGRVDFAAGRGYDRREYLPFKVSFEENQTIFEEGMEVVRLLWQAEDRISHRGRHYQFENVRITPKPVQNPLPAYVASFSKPSIELAARLRIHTIFAPFAAAMLYGSVENAAREAKRMAVEAGHPDPKVMCSYFAAVAHSPEEADRARERLLHYLHSVIPVLPNDRSKTPPHIAYFVDIVERLRGMKPSQLGDKSIVTGDAEHCIEVLKKCEDGGLREVILYFNFGELGHRDTLRAMERFAREVMPHFAGTKEAVAV